jgi:hypothetical protein
MDGLLIGDLVPMKVGKTEHHLSVLIDTDHVIHCHRQKGVMITSIETVSEYMTNLIYRIFK